MLYKRLHYLATNPDAPVAFDFIDAFRARGARLQLNCVGAHTSNAHNAGDAANDEQCASDPSAAASSSSSSLFSSSSSSSSSSSCSSSSSSSSSVPLPSPSPPLSSSSSPPPFFSMAAEMHRLRLPSEHYRMTTLNEHYQLCASYPAQLFVPAQVRVAERIERREGDSNHLNGMMNAKQSMT